MIVLRIVIFGVESRKNRFEQRCQPGQRVQLYRFAPRTGCAGDVFEIPCGVFAYLAHGERFAFLGGAFMGYGARLARGCTSGQALSGGAVLSVGSWAFMFAVFGGAYALAYFVKKLWN